MALRLPIPVILTVFIGMLFTTQFTAQAQEHPIAADKRAVIEHWTPERRAMAIPRDLRIGTDNQGYLRQADGSLLPYGLQNTSQKKHPPTPQAKPSDSNDTPSVINMITPDGSSSVGETVDFSAQITDEQGIKSVSFIIIYPDGFTQSFSPSEGSNNHWIITLSGFNHGDWGWYIVVKDSGSKGGNTTVSDPIFFTVEIGGGSGGTGEGDTIINEHWTAGGMIQSVAGRIYFEMPGNAKRKGPWSGYVCSGTVAEDSTWGRSIIITAAHCVYDDVNKAFARNVLFIPNQDATSGSGTDLNCNNDPVGCWAPSFAVVDIEWTNDTFPNNIAWDYAFYVVNDTGAHSGTAAPDSLDQAVGALSVNFAPPYYDDGEAAASSPDFTHALGYSYNDDPNFMYCAEDMTTNGSSNWWLPSCGLSGGSSGGAWMQPVDNGNGVIISINSWGYTNSPGMAAPKLSGSTAECLFEEAKILSFAAVPTTNGDAGVTIAYCP